MIMKKQEALDFFKRVYESNNPEIMKRIVKGCSIVQKDNPALDEIGRAQEIINNSSEDHMLYRGRPYMLSTQNQRYLQQTVPENAQSAFVILSPGDTTFELILKDLKRIVAVDTNDMQQMVFKLRWASILTLNAKDFDSFTVNSRHDRFMNQEVYNHVRPAIKEEKVQCFWDHVLSVNDRQELKENFFKNANDDLFAIKQSLSFLRNKSTYYDLRNKLEQNPDVITPIVDAIQFFDDNPDVKFDYIDITNILLFIYQMECNNDIDLFRQKIIKLRQIFEKNLNPGGTFVLDYLFGTSKTSVCDLEKLKDLDPKAQTVYFNTYKLLQEYFELDHAEYSRIIHSFGKENDTVVFTKKPKF